MFDNSSFNPERIDSLGKLDKNSSEILFSEIDKHQDAKWVIYIDIDDTLFLSTTETLNQYVIDYLLNIRSRFSTVDITFKILTARLELSYTFNSINKKGITSILNGLKTRGIEIAKENVIFTNEEISNKILNLKAKNEELTVDNLWDALEFHEEELPKTKIESILKNYGIAVTDGKFSYDTQENFTKGKLIQQDMQANFFDRAGFIDDNILQLTKVEEIAKERKVICVKVEDFSFNLHNFFQRITTPPIIENNLSLQPTTKKIGKTN